MNPDGEQTWNWAEMKKYMMKVSLRTCFLFLTPYPRTWRLISQSETYHQPNASRLRQFSAVVNLADHGTSGPIQTAWCQYIYPLVELWIPAWLSMGLEAKDLGSGDTREFVHVRLNRMSS